MIPSNIRSVRKLCFLHVILSKNFSQGALELANKDVKYPPIIDALPEGRKRRERQMFYDRILSMPTVEEKLHEISAQRDRKHRVYYISSAATRFSGSQFQPYITRTHLIRGLPQQLQERNVDEVASELAPRLSEIVASQFTDPWKTGLSFGERISYEIISTVYRILCFKHDFLRSSALDMKPRIDSYWWHGGFSSEKDKLLEKNLCFQYNGHPKFALRIRSPLPPVVPQNDPLCTSADVAEFNYHPTCSGLVRKRYMHITSVPGFWPGDPCEYPLLSFHTTENISKLKEKLDHAETFFPAIEDGFGIMSSFGWLMGIAMYQGFTPFHDITYPLVTQTVLTDGQDWNFFVYQLNTICFHEDVDLKNRRNLCWSSGKMRLFETIENGELKGVDDSVFKILLKFFLNSSEVPEGVKLKPYLSAPTKSVEEMTVLKESLLKMYSNRRNPRAHLDEVPLWQHIYKWHRDAPPSPLIKLK